MLLLDRESGLPPINSSRCGPHGYWFLVAAALSNCTKPSDKYVVAVYKCWHNDKVGLHKSLGQAS